MAKQYEPVQNIISPYAQAKFNADFKYLFDQVRVQGKSISDLVADGQLTEKQYGDLLIILNDLPKSGEINIFDLESNLRQVIENKAENEEFENLKEITNSNYNSLNQKINNLTSGSPKGVYENLAELENEHPNGDDGIYLVGGDWYYWDGSNWQNGGTYQSQAIGDGTVKTESLTTETANRIFNGKTYLSEYNLEMGVVGYDGTDRVVDYGIRTAGYIKVFKGTMVKLTDYENYKLRVSQYNLSDKTEYKTEMNLTNDYYVMDDCYIRISVTTYPQSTVENIGDLSNLCIINHKLVDYKSRFDFENESIEISYDENGQPINIISDSGTEKIKTDLYYNDGRVAEINESIGNLSTITTLQYDENGKVKSINKTRSEM